MVLVVARDAPPWIQMSYSRPLLGTAWAIWAIATISLGARFFIRYQRFARLFWDDLFVAISFVFSILLGAQFTLANLHSKQSVPFFNNRQLTQFFYYTCLWSIKISFLIFFRKMGGTALRGLRYYWRGVTGFTIFTYFALLATQPWKCFIQKGIKACADDPELGRMIPYTFRVACTLDILTDCLIMAIPFAVLWRVQLPLRKRLILYFIFSLVIITMIVAIIRAVYSASKMGKKMDLTLLLFFSYIEGNTAIIVACVGSFRTLFTQDDNSRSPAYQRSRISNSRRRNFQRTDSSDALQSTDLQYMSPAHLESSLDSQSGGHKGLKAPKAHFREEVYIPGKPPG